MCSFVGVVMTKAMCCSDLTDPNIGRCYSKMIVYGVCMDLQADFVGLASSFAWTITSIVTKIGPAIKFSRKFYHRGNIIGQEF